MGWSGSGSELFVGLIGSSPVLTHSPCLTLFELVRSSQFTSHTLFCPRFRRAQHWLRSLTPFHSSVPPTLPFSLSSLIHSLFSHFILSTNTHRFLFLSPPAHFNSLTPCILPSAHILVIFTLYSHSCYVRMPYSHFRRVHLPLSHYPHTLSPNPHRPRSLTLTPQPSNPSKNTTTTATAPSPCPTS